MKHLVEEDQTTAADLAMDALDMLPHQIELLIKKVAIDHNLHATKKDYAVAMELIKEALGDLFAIDRARLIDVAPIRPALRPFPQNPATHGDGL